MYTDSATRCQVYPLWETLSIGETCRLASQKPSRPESAAGVCKSTCPPALENSKLRRGSLPERSPPSITVHFDNRGAAGRAANHQCRHPGRTRAPWCRCGNQRKGFAVCQSGTRSNSLDAERRDRPRSPPSRGHAADKARKVDGSRAAHADASSNASSRTSFAMVPDAMLISSFTQPFEALIRPLVD